MCRMSAAARVAGAVLAVTLGFSGGPAGADGEEHHDHGVESPDFTHGAPAAPSDPWLLAAGGRIYDNWWEALDRDEPEGTNPAYPAAGRQEGEVTWRCKECHGWDYLGAEGIYRAGSHFTGIKGVLGVAGQPVEAIMPLLRDANHPYTTAMISEEEMLRVAAFLSAGLVDMRAFIDYDTRTVKAGVGDFDRGRAIFQTICAACHGFDGRAMDWGEGDDHNFVGTEAAELPDEVYNKIANAHPGAAMVNLRAFGHDDRVSLLAYIATLPVGMDD